MNWRRRRPDTDSSRQGGAEPAPVVDAYFDARGGGRPARSIMDRVLRDASVLDELARDREWIDEVRTSAEAPDQTSQIMGRLGIDLARFDGRRHRFVLLSRRLSTAAVLAFAFVVGMWARSSLVFSPGADPVPTAHQLERVIESLPIQRDPLESVRGMMLQVADSLADPEMRATPVVGDTRPAAPRESAASRHPGRATLDAATPPAGDPAEFFDEEIDVESLKTIYKDLGIV